MKKYLFVRTFQTGRCSPSHKIYNVDCYFDVSPQLFWSDNPRKSAEGLFALLI